MEVATDVDAKAALHHWLMSLDENLTNKNLLRVRNARMASVGGYGSSDDESGGSDGEKC